MSQHSYGQWTQLGFNIDGEAAGDQSGWSVSLSLDGNRLAIGARGNDGAGSDAGLVRVYAWNGTVWSRLGDDIDGEAAGDYSGESVSLSSDGSRLAIGAPGSNGGTGQVKVYAWNGTAWSQLGDDIDGEAAEDYSGYSVSLSSDGSRLAISTIGSNLSTGHVRVYEGFQRSEHTTPLPLMSSWQLLLCGLLLVSLSGIAFGNKAKRVV